MRINVTYGGRRLQLKVPAYVVLPTAPDECLRVLLQESYFSGCDADLLPDETVRLEVLATIGFDLRARKFLVNDLIPLLDEDCRRQVFDALSRLERGP